MTQLLAAWRHAAADGAGVPSPLVSRARAGLVSTALAGSRAVLAALAGTLAGQGTFTGVDATCMHRGSPAERMPTRGRITRRAHAVHAQRPDHLFYIMLSRRPRDASAEYAALQVAQSCGSAFGRVGCHVQVS